MNQNEVTNVVAAPVDNASESSRVESDHPDEGFSADRIRRMMAYVRRRSFWRQMGISALVFIFASFTFLWLNATMLQRMGWRCIAPVEEAGILFTNPNTYGSVSGHGGMTLGILGGTIRTQLYRVVGQTPVHTGERWVSFGWFGERQRREPADAGGPFTNDPRAQAIRLYNYEAAAPILFFYRPHLDYGFMYDDLPRLADAGENVVAEVAISLDSLYSVEQVRDMLPSAVRPQWYAVNIWEDPRSDVAGDTKGDANGNADRKDLPLSISPVVHERLGFPTMAWRPDSILDGRDSTDYWREAFLSSVEEYRAGNNPRWATWFRGNQNADLFEKAAQYLEGHDLKVYGVVVTGKAIDLLQLRDCDWVRASVLGLCVHEY